MNKSRCSWPEINDLMLKYHDTEWGVPHHDDKVLFEYILLDSFQAGLSWDIILKKRKNFRKAFNGFNYKKIAEYDAKKIGLLLKDAGIIRNRLKIKATVRNAQIFMDIQKEFGSFDKYLRGFMGGEVKRNKWRTLKQVPATSKESDAISKNLYSRGFRFFGSIICYAFMQGAGLVNDHVVTCFRYKEIQKLQKIHNYN